MTVIALKDGKEAVELVGRERLNVRDEQGGELLLFVGVEVRTVEKGIELERRGLAGVPAREDEFRALAGESERIGDDQDCARLETVLDGADGFF